MTQPTSLPTSRWRAIGILLVSIACGVGCASYDVRSAHDTAADFSRYHTFAFLPDRALIVSTDQPVSPQLEDYLKAAAGRALSAKGFDLAQDAARADLVVAFTLGSRQQLGTTSYPVEYRGPLGWGGVVYESDMRDQTQGLLSVDIFDAATRRPVWQGFASKQILPEDRGRPQLIDEIVSAILADFPPQP